MQASGVYWIGLYPILEKHGLEVRVTKARYTQRLPGRKSDVQECQWLQKLHPFGLLPRSCRPTEEFRAQAIPAGTYIAPDGQAFTNMPAFCRIAATLTPTRDLDIGIEVWMPASIWNGTFKGVGKGGFAGSIEYSAWPLASGSGTPPLAQTPVTSVPPMTHPLRLGIRTNSSILDIARSI
jgi:hypothetical protein